MIFSTTDSFLLVFAVYKHPALRVTFVQYVGIHFYPTTLKGSMVLSSLERPGARSGSRQAAMSC